MTGFGFSRPGYCARTGNCAAGGFYYDCSGHSQAFVADEINGIWKGALRVPGTATLGRDAHGDFPDGISADEHAAGRASHFGVGSLVGYREI